MALLSRAMLHFTGHLSLSRFHCHTEFVMKFSKQSASKNKNKQKNRCQSLPYVKASRTRTKPNHFSSN